MDLRKVFTLDPLRFPLDLMQQLVDYLHSHQQHYIVMVDPAVAYQNYSGFTNGAVANAFLHNPNGSWYNGVVWPGVTVSTSSSSLGRCILRTLYRSSRTGSHLEHKATGTMNSFHSSTPTVDWTSMDFGST